MSEDYVGRIIIGVGAFVFSAFLAYIFAFVTGLIFLSEVALAGVLGFLGGLGGGYSTKAGWRIALVVGFLGGVLGAIPVAMTAPYNPVPGGVSGWVQMLKGFTFIALGSVGGLVGNYMRMNPSPPGSWGPGPPGHFG